MFDTTDRILSEIVVREKENRPFWRIKLLIFQIAFLENKFLTKSHHS